MLVAGMTGRVLIDEATASFLMRGNSIVIATRSAALDPNVTRACAIRLLSPDRIAVLVPRPTGTQTIANLRHNGEAAVCLSSPLDYRTVQLKGRSVAIDDASTDDILLAEEQLRSFSEAVARFRMTRQQARNLWLFDSWRVEIAITAAYAQTPGPGAGGRLA
jgi:hypothetical protein